MELARYVHMNEIIILNFQCVLLIHLIGKCSEYLARVKVEVNVSIDECLQVLALLL